MAALPQDFINKMRCLLGEQELEAFISSYNESKNSGLRANTIRIEQKAFEDLSIMNEFQLETIPWTTDGYYYNDEKRPGVSPYYYAGLYYIQEPSAMFPVSVLNSQPGERILDMCAAPGGKTVQIAATMENSGVIVTNDINPKRVKALVKNIELCGIKNAIVTNDTPENLGKAFEGFFDRILVDAPCSGEGMFRKDPDAIKAWGAYKCDACAQLQADILTYADKMLKPGGTLVYSTCTFSPEEDEIIIASFLNKYGNYFIDEIEHKHGIAEGVPEWADGNTTLKGTARLWPHRLKGEGHFVARLKKASLTEDNNCNENNISQSQYKPSILSPSEENKSILNDFIRDNLSIELNGELVEIRNKLYLLPEGYGYLANIKAVKYGWYLGDIINNRFEPSQSFIMGLSKREIKRVIDFTINDYEVIKYLKGETLNIECEKGLYAICVDGYTIGFAKSTGANLKNMYPKGWRKMN